MRQRADILLFSRGLSPSRDKARALILAGRVYSGERRVEKAGEQLPDDAPLSVRGEDLRYVSRGGLKLEGALTDFALSPQGVVAADFGASTGGFTDCLLQHGAMRVFAIDVGYGQLDHRLRIDPRVHVMERTNARHLVAGDLAEPVDWVVIDASFIGLEKLLPAAAKILKPEGHVLALVKPQFQVGRREAARSAGVIRDEGLRIQAIDQVAADASSLGFAERARSNAAIKGPKGNQECFLWLTLRPDAERGVPVDPSGAREGGFEPP